MVNVVKKYDVILVDFGEGIGSEQTGKRPCVVIQNDQGNYFSSTTIVIPFTSRFKNTNQKTHALIRKGINKGIDRDSMLLAECTRQISNERIVKTLGRLDDISDRILVKSVYLANLGED